MQLFQSDLSFVVLLQHGAEPTIQNTDGRTALDLAEPSTKAVLTGEWALKPLTGDQDPVLIQS